MEIKTRKMKWNLNAIPAIVLLEWKFKQDLNNAIRMEILTRFKQYN